MPIQLVQETQSAPQEITIDASGKEIYSQSIEKIDANGYHLSEQDLIQSTPETEASQEKSEDSQEAPKNSDAETRKLYLQAQKAKRKADEMEKKASVNLAKSEAMEKAIQLAESGEDPTAVLKAAGLDPIKFYQNMTAYALKPESKPEDPVTKELREHKERLDKYAKDLEVQAATIKEKEEVAAHNQVITTAVIPLLQNEPDRFECLLTEYGKDAAVQVYKTVWEIYQKTGVARKFDEVADEMEKYWENQIESGIKAASNLKKFQNRFAQESNQEQRYQAPEQTETPKRSPTLSNKQSISTSAPKPYDRYLSPNERAAEILKRHT